MLDKVGFDSIVIKPLSGFWGTLCRLPVYYHAPADCSPKIHRLGAVALLSPAIRSIAFLLDRLDTLKEWIWMYPVDARRPRTSG
jgi:hypothetical protein